MKSSEHTRATGVWRHASVAALILLACAGANGEAVRPTLSYLVSTSDVILVGRVERVDTVAELQVANVTAEKLIRSGGDVAPFHFLAQASWSCDVSTATAGETVVLFLQRLMPSDPVSYIPSLKLDAALARAIAEHTSHDPLYRIAAHGYGRLVIDSGSNGERMVRTDERVYLPSGASPLPDACRVVQREHVSLDEFLELVASEMGDEVLHADRFERYLAAEDVRLPNEADAAGLTGAYSHGDGLTGRSLELFQDGSYVAVRWGCTGIYGSAKGTWVYDGCEPVIHFYPDEEVDWTYGKLRHVDAVVCDDKIILVPPEYPVRKEQFVPTRWFCYYPVRPDWHVADMMLLWEGK